ncbi:MAG TPA: hypothetical protein VH143_23765 [Kofleriaceae bacterium]|nr:hypothetical protein [Kofleriaceae bacterium]
MNFLAVNLPAEPTIARSPSGVVVATLGCASDNADAELIGLLEAVDRELAEPPAEIELAALVEPLEDQQIEAAPTWPTARVPAPLIWGFHAGAIASVMTSATRRLALFQRMRRTVNRGQLVAMMAQPGPALDEFGAIVRGLGIAIKTLGPQLVVHVEIERADATKLSAFGGRDYVVRQRFGALRAIDDGAFATTLREITVTEPVVIFRSPRLRAIIDANPRAEELARELVARREPMFAMREGDGDGMFQPRLMDGERVLPIYGDKLAAEWGAHDHGVPSATIGTIPFHVAAQLATKHELGLGIGVYRDRKTPVYALLPASFVATLA